MITVRSTSKRGERRSHIARSTEVKKKLRNLRFHSFPLEKPLKNEHALRNAEMRAMRRNYQHATPALFSWRRTWADSNNQTTAGDLKTRYYKGRMYVLTPPGCTSANERPSCPEALRKATSTGISFFEMCVLFVLSFAFSALLLLICTVLR